MNAIALTQSIGSISSGAACDECGAIALLNHEACVHCLLRNGLTPDERGDRLDLLLAGIDVRDADWTVGNYQILEEIGRGGMGVIYRARQRHSKRIVALKRLLSYHGDSRETLERFRREAEAAASLDHPNILPIFEVGDENGLPFFTMKYAASGSLLQLRPMLRHKARECVQLVLKVTRAVSYAHGEGILHRDIKPGNVLLDGRGEPMVSDFGLAKWLDRSTDLTRTLTVFGTPGYVAPEQAHASKAQLTAAADLYSLGALLFELLAGRPPFLGEHALAVIKQAEDKPAPKLRSLFPSADRDLETMCAKCLERQPSLRYESAEELADDLQRWLDGKPIRARPVAAPVKVARWAKRKPLAAVSLGIVFLLACVAIGSVAQRRELAAAAQARVLAHNSIAVLPFLDIDTVSADFDGTFSFTGALQRLVTKHIPARIVPIETNHLWLAGAGNAAEIIEANRTTNARIVLSGVVRQFKGDCQLWLRAFDGKTGQLIWLKHFERRDAAVLRIADQLTAMIRADDLVQFADQTTRAEEPARAAEDLVSSARQLMWRNNIADLDRAIACLRKAVEISPGSALAHASLGSALATRSRFERNSQLLAEAEAEARSAIRDDESLPLAHRALAGICYTRDDLFGAVAEVSKAVQFQGADERAALFMATMLLHLGRPSHALRWLEMSRHWASLPGVHDAWVADCWALMGEDERAEKYYKRCMELRPEITDGWVGLSRLRLLQGDAQAAEEIWHKQSQAAYTYDEFDHKVELLGAQIQFYQRRYAAALPVYERLAATDKLIGHDFYGALTAGSALAVCRFELNAPGAVDEVDKYLSERKAAPHLHENPSALFDIAATEAAIGRLKDAESDLSAAMRAGWLDVRTISIDPRFAKLRATSSVLQAVIRQAVARAADERDAAVAATLQQLESN